MWVVQGLDAQASIYAYNMSTKARDPTKEFDQSDLNPANSAPGGIWSNGTTMWVADSGADKIFAYQLDTKTYDGSFDFNTLNSAGNNVARGIWSNGTTMWVADFADKKLYAYDMGTRNRAGTADFDTLIAAGLLSAFGIAGDGTTMWVIDAFGVKVYAFNQPSSDAALSALAVSPDDIAGFDADRTSYEVGVASTVAEATVTASASHAAAEVAYSGVDADLVAAGYQVSLSAGRNAVTVTVTAEDGSTQDYTLSINRAVAAQYGWNAVRRPRRADRGRQPESPRHLGQQQHLLHIGRRRQGLCLQPRRDPRQRQRIYSPSPES